MAKSQLAKTLEYWGRQSVRLLTLLGCLFLLFCFIMFLAYIVPKIWNFVF